MEMRVEQLSVQSGVAVDTIRYYQSKGLLDPPRREGRVAWYDEVHLERLGRVRTLQQRGFTLATIVRLLDGELDAADEALIGELSGVEVSDPPPLSERRSTPPPVPSTPSEAPAPDPADGRTFSLAELATETGVPLALLKAIEAEGLLIPRRMGDHDRYTAEDVAASRAGLLLLEWGIPLSALLDVARRHHEATEAVAREAVAMFSAHIRGPLRQGKDPRGLDAGTDEGARAQADAGASVQSSSGPAAGDAEGSGAEIEGLLLAYEQLLPAVTALVGHHFSRALVKAALDHVEQVGSDEERRAIWDQAGLTDPLADDRRAGESADQAPASLA